MTSDERMMTAEQLKLRIFALQNRLQALRGTEGRFEAALRRNPAEAAPSESAAHGPTADAGDPLRVRSARAARGTPCLMRTAGKRSHAVWPSAHSRVAHRQQS